MAERWTLGLGVTGLNFEEVRQGWWTLDCNLKKSRFQVYCINFKFKLVYLKIKKTFMNLNILNIFVLK